MSSSRLVDDVFRHEYGRLVAVLVRRVGVQHLHVIEDAVQSALLSALERWAGAGRPDNPSAWLFRVAHNNVLGALRTGSRRERLLAQEHRLTEPVLAPAAAEPPLAGEIQDDLLRMVFVCCDDSLPIESQLMLALKVVCGFDVHEIALRLFTTHANVYKRLGRARQRLAGLSPQVLDLAHEHFSERLGAALRVLYLMFTEGHLASGERGFGARGSESPSSTRRSDASAPELPIRRELCTEAIRLATIVAEHPLGRTPETCALLALMHLHLARMSARVDGSGELLLLEEQDRSAWDQSAIHTGLSWLAESARGETYSRYHAEAAIAAEHCLAPSFAETRWEKIVLSYALLEQVAPSPLHRLNRAVAMAEWQGPAAGLAVLDGFTPPEWLSRSWLWSAALADLHRRSPDPACAPRYREEALARAPSAAIALLLDRRLQPANGRAR